MLELVFLSGVRAGVVIPLANGLVAGRDAECSLELPDPRVSRVHARFHWNGASCHLVDNESSNGTFVNEKPVKTADLRPGDVVRMGGTRLRVQALSKTKSGTRVSASSVFELQDQGVPEMSHSVSMAELDQPAASTDPVVLQQRLASMVHVSELLATIRNLDEQFEPVLDTLVGLLPQTDRAFLMLGDRLENLEPRAMRQRAPTTAGPLAVSRAICRAALEKKAAIVYREGTDTPIHPSHSMIDLHIRTALAVPLMISDEILGLVVLDSREVGQAYTEADLELAAAVCHQVAVAIKNAQLVDEVAYQTAERNNLMRFLPQAMAEQVLAGEVDAGLGGRRYQGTVLFSDLVGFTRRAEDLPPDELVTLLNEYFNAVVPCIDVEGGSVDKFMGDAIMAVWGIPIGNDKSDLRAVSAALAMQASLVAFNSQRRQPLHMGIGVNTGDVLAGNIGTESRREYTVLGDAVNTAQRIGAAACLEQVLVGVACWERLGARAFGVRMPPLTAKNKSDPVQCFSARGIAIGDEVQLFFPVRFGELQGWLIRRLDDGSMILLHQPGTPSDLVTCAVELPGRELGLPKIEAVLAPEAGDGSLQRARITLDDPTLGGLLDAPAQTSSLLWDQMDRAETSKSRSHQYGV